MTPVIACGAAALTWLLTPPLVAGAAGEYAARRTVSTGEALLAADETAWGIASAVDWGPAAYSTRFRALWSEKGLFLRFDATDPDPWFTLTRRDDHLWEEEVVEIFLDPNRSGRDYAELEISPGNVVCDVRMVSPWPNKQMDFSFNIDGLLTRVREQRDASGHPSAWIATAFIPWSGLRPLPSVRGVHLPPLIGDRWRFNLFRVDRPGGKAEPEKNAIEVPWSPIDEPSFHVPRAFRDLVFEK